MFKKIIGKFSNLFMAICSLFWKRDKNVVLVGSWFGEKFADNSRYLYQYLFDNKEFLNLNKVVWVTRNKKLCDDLNDMGYEAYMMDSKESVYYHKHAGTHIICNNPVDSEFYKGDIDGRYSFGAKRINLWHGTGGIKGVGFASNEYKIKKESHPYLASVIEFLHSKKWYRIISSPGGWKECYFLTTSELGKNILKSYFMLPDENFIITLLPRNMECIRETNTEAEMISKLEKYDRVIMYLPTFRDVVNSIENPVENIEFIDYLEVENCLFVTKQHDAERNKYALDTENVHILNLPSNVDINVLIPYVDLIITDYSSVVWDGAYYNIPVLFYMPDFHEYGAKDRGFLLEPKDFIIGKKCENVLELLNILRDSKGDYKIIKTDNYTEKRELMWSSNCDYDYLWKILSK